MSLHRRRSILTRASHPFSQSDPDLSTKPKAAKSPWLMFLVALCCATIWVYTAKEKAPIGKERETRSPRPRTAVVDHIVHLEHPVTFALPTPSALYTNTDVLIASFTTNPQYTPSRIILQNDEINLSQDITSFCTMQQQHTLCQYNLDSAQPSSDYRIVAQGTNLRASSPYFTIVNDSVSLSTLQQGSISRIEWNTTASSDIYDIYLLHPFESLPKTVGELAKSLYKNIVTGFVSQTATYTWLIPTSLIGEYRIAVIARKSPKGVQKTALLNFELDLNRDELLVVTPVFEVVAGESAVTQGSHRPTMLVVDDPNDLFAETAVSSTYAYKVGEAFPGNSCSESTLLVMISDLYEPTTAYVFDKAFNETDTIPQSISNGNYSLYCYNIQTSLLQGVTSSFQIEGSSSETPLVLP